MNIESEYEQQAIRKSKINILLKQVCKTRTFECKQFHITHNNTTPPPRVYSYSRSIRHFQEILNKTGDRSLDQRVGKLLCLPRPQCKINQFQFTAQQTHKNIQTDDSLIIGTQTERVESRKMKQSFYIRQRKFTDNYFINSEKRAICNSPKLDESTHKFKEFQFNNKLIQQSIQKSPRPKKRKIVESVFTTMPFRLKS